MKVKAEKMKDLVKIGFEENTFHPNYVFETRSKKGTYVFITVCKGSKIIEGLFSGVENIPMEKTALQHFCPALFEQNFIEEENNENV